MYRRCCDDPTILSDDDRETTITGLAAWPFAYQLLFLLSSFSWVPHTRSEQFPVTCVKFNQRANDSYWSLSKIKTVILLSFYPPPPPPPTHARAC